MNNFGGEAGIYRNGVTDGNRLVLKLRGKGQNPSALGAVVRVEMASEPKSANADIDRFARVHVEQRFVAVFWIGGREAMLQRCSSIGRARGGRSCGIWKRGKRYLIEEPEGITAVKSEEQKTLFVPSENIPRIAPREQFFNDFERQPLLPCKHSQMGPGLAIGDLDGDGNEDLYAGYPSGREGRVYLGIGKSGDYSRRLIPALGEASKVKTWRLVF